jgi:hypothetical protein
MNDERKREQVESAMHVTPDMVAEARAKMLDLALARPRGQRSPLEWMDAAGYALPANVDDGDTAAKLSWRMAAAEAVCQMLGAAQVIPVGPALSESAWRVPAGYGQGFTIGDAPKLPLSVVLAPSLRYRAPRS